MPTLPRPIEPDTATAPQAEHAHYYRSVLHELIDLGADLARQVHAQAKAAPAITDADPTIAFDRIARCVRRSIALARILDDPAPAHSDRVQRRIAARKRIIRAVEDVIQRRPGNNESLHAELLDRLDEPDLDDDIDGRPIDDIIADIRRDLGLDVLQGAHPWQRRTPADIATLFARAARPYGATHDEPTRRLGSARSQSSGAATGDPTTRRPCPS